MKGRLTWLAVCGLFLFYGCSDGTGPTAGTLNVTLASPNGDDGAVLFTISGGPVDSVESVGYPLFSARPDANTVTIIVTGTIGSGAIARIHVPDSRQASRYAASIGQVAARSTYAQREPVSYAITLAP